MTKQEINTQLADWGIYSSKKSDSQKIDELHYRDTSGNVREIDTNGLTQSDVMTIMIAQLISFLQTIKNILMFWSILSLIGTVIIVFNILKIMSF